MVAPLVDTRITANDLTTARLVTGLAACAAFALGNPTWNLWGGVFWLLSCLLDRADGELARLGGKTTPWGHRYDYYCDVAINGLFFVAIGFGLSHGEMGGLAITLGFLAGGCVATASVLAEWLEQVTDDGAKAYSGILGFDFDDLLYLLGPAAWFGAFPYILIGAAVCTPVVAGLTAFRYYRLRSMDPAEGI